MLKSFKTLRWYYKLAGVKGYLIFFEFIMFLIPSILSIVSPVLAANAITALTVYDFSKAMLMLSLDFGIIIITSILYFIYHLISNKTTKSIVYNLQEYVYTNVSLNDKLTKVSSSTLSSIWECAEFNRTFLYKICFMIKSIILLGILFYFNLIIGGVIALISIITYFLLRITDKKIQASDLDLDESKRNSLEFFNNIQQGTKSEPNKLLNKSLKDKYFAFVDYSVKTSNKMSLFYSLNNNFISLILKSAVFAFTIYLVTLIKTTTLTLSLYLILTPYLTSAAENLISFFELFPELVIIENSLKEFESLKFQEDFEEPKNVNITSFNLYFSSVSLNVSKHSTIKNVDLYIKHKSSVLIYGEAGSGKRALFSLLSRKEKPTSGTILIDNKNIYDISENQYSKLVSATTSNPHFYKMSIYENLYMVSENKNKIYKTIKQFGLKEQIDKLENKLNTVIDESIPAEIIFFLGLARSYLSGAKIILIYEIPESLSKESKLRLNKILKSLSSECTVIIFTHNDLLGFKFTQKVFVDNFMIKSIKTAKSLNKS